MKPSAAAAAAAATQLIPPFLFSIVICDVKTLDSHTNKDMVVLNSDKALVVWCSGFDPDGVRIPAGPC